MKYQATVDEETINLDLNTDDHIAVIDGRSQTYSFEQQDNGRILLRIGTKLHKIDNVDYDTHTVEFTLNGRLCQVEVQDEQELLLDELGFKTAAEIGEGQLNAPMPGKILEIMVQEGDTVELGQPVAILEAMKMENELKAPVDGTISTIAVREGDSVEKNALILEIEAIG